MTNIADAESISFLEVGTIMTSLTSNGVELSVTGTAAAATTWTEWFDYIEVTNNSTTLSVWVSTDGATAAVVGAGMDCVPPMQSRLFPNRQAKGQWSKVGAGGDPLSAGTVQNCQNGTAASLPASGFGTWISLVGSAAGPTVVNVSPQ